MPKTIFVSYRRDDASAEARSIFTHLQKSFGDKSVFMDVDSIQRGRDFREVLDGQLRDCGAVLAIIGRNWVPAVDSAGNRRLHDPFDFVRLEIERALKQGIPVIPVLVGGALMPKLHEIPDALAQLLYRQAITINHESFARDITALEHDLSQVIANRTRRWLTVSAVAVALISLLGFLSYDIVLAEHSILKSMVDAADFTNAGKPTSFARVTDGNVDTLDHKPAASAGNATASALSTPLIVANSADRAYEIARASGTESALLDFVDKFPNDPRALKFKHTKGDQEAWRGAERSDTREAYESYIVRYPDGVYLPNAKQRIAALLTRPAAPAYRPPDPPPQPSYRPQDQPAPTYGGSGSGTGTTYYKTSFDCATDQGVDEQAICTSPSLSTMDLQLSNLFSALKARYGSGSEFVNLRSEQRIWLQSRAACGSDTQCLARIYSFRIGQLQSRMR